MKNFKSNLFLFAFVFILFSCESKANCTSSQNNFTVNDNADKKSPKIQVALLLDTSNSMDGLINQAKSRLWNIVNTLTTLKFKGKEPQIEIALYEYGNSNLSRNENFIKQITPLTQDLDLISEKLFALRTRGGDEYCGAVIQEAHKGLDWSGEKESMKLIYIAGNEPFTQGEVNYKEAVSSAYSSDIYVNTIFCGKQAEGIRTSWKDGADVGNGKYFNIDANQSVVYIPSPYDDEIRKCNTRLNDTYIGYGRLRNKKESQMMEDKKAYGISSENSVNRAISKSKKNVYNNAHWDLVDKMDADESFLDEVSISDLPDEFKGKTKEQQKEIVENKAKERKEIQKEIAELSKKREAFLTEERKKQGANIDSDLGVGIQKSILELATKNGFSVE